MPKIIVTWPDEQKTEYADATATVEPGGVLRLQEGQEVELLAAGTWMSAEWTEPPSRVRVL